MELPLFLHDTADRSGFSVLYHGGLRDRSGRRMAATSTEKEGSIHSNSVPVVVSRRSFLHIPRWDVCLPNTRLVRGQRLLPIVPDILRVHIDIVGVWGEQILRRHKRDDRLLPDEVVEVLLGNNNTSHLHRKYRPPSKEFLFILAIRRACSSSIWCNGVP